MTPISWLPDDAPSAEWFDKEQIAFQIEGHDIVHITRIDEDTGNAHLTVWASTHPHARPVWEGTVNIKERQ